MIHKAFSLILATGGLLLVAPAAQAVTFDLVENGAVYDALMTVEAGDPAIFAVDMFIQGTDGAMLTVANNNGNPYDRATMNDAPEGNPGAILIGGSDISGGCSDTGNSCFADASCTAPATCVFGQTGTVKFGEVNWNGVGTVSLRNNSAGVDGNLIPVATNNTSGCSRINGEEVLAGDDANGNGIVRACECGDPNQSGLFESADLFDIFNCQTGGGGLPGPDPSGQNEPCKTRIHNGDGQNTGSFEAADLFVTFNGLTAPSSPAILNSTCPARPAPFTP